MFLSEDTKIKLRTSNIDPVDEGNYILDVVALLEELNDILVFLIVTSLAIVPDHNVIVHLLSIPITNLVQCFVVCGESCQKPVAGNPSKQHIPPRLVQHDSTHIHACFGIKIAN